MKRYLLGIFAVIIAVGLSAFTGQKPKVSKLTPQNFSYNHFHDDTWKDDPAHYTLATGGLSCSGSTYRCGVSAENDGTDHPILSGSTIFKEN